MEETSVMMNCWALISISGAKATARENAHVGGVGEHTVLPFDGIVGGWEYRKESCLDKPGMEMGMGMTVFQDELEGGLTKCSTRTRTRRALGTSWQMRRTSTDWLPLFTRDGPDPLIICLSLLHQKGNITTTMFLWISSLMPMVIRL